MVFSFKYKQVKLKNGNILYRPLIPIGFEGKNRIDVFAILDSGSDMSIIPQEIAELLDLEYFKENEIYGISGNAIKTKESKLFVKFGKGKEIYNFEIPILVVSENKDAQIIIGRIGFFEQFKITFIESSKRIEFKKSQVSMHL